jgi:hypothetical protein
MYIPTLRAWPTDHGQGYEFYPRITQIDAEDDLSLRGFHQPKARKARS